MQLGSWYFSVCRFKTTVRSAASAHLGWSCGTEAPYATDTASTHAKSQRRILATSGWYPIWLVSSSLPARMVLGRFNGLSARHPADFDLLPDLPFARTSGRKDHLGAARDLETQTDAGDVFDQGLDLCVIHEPFERRSEWRDDLVAHVARLGRHNTQAAAGEPAHGHREVGHGD